MKVVICGAGQVGIEIAQYLISENTDVVIIEKDPILATHVGEIMDVQVITGNAALPDVLEKASVTNADILIAVTKSDEVNIVCCQMAYHLFNIPIKIARLRHQSYSTRKWHKLFKQGDLPIDVIISPERSISGAIYRRIHTYGAIDVILFANDIVRVVGVRCGTTCPIINTPLRQLSNLFPDLKLTILSVIRDEQHLIPDSHLEMQLGDYVYFAVATQHMERAMNAFGYEHKDTRNLLIVGGGPVGRRLAIEMLEKDQFADVTLVELNRNVAEEIAARLSGVNVIVGDILDSNLLDNLSLQNFDTAVTVTNDDELNTLSILMLKKRGVQRGISLNKNTAYNSLIGDLGVDIVVNPGSITISQILQYIRHGKIEAVHSVHDGVFEVFEATALITSSLVGLSLKDAKLPKGVIVGAVVRYGEAIMARPSTVIQEDDKVILLLRHVDVKKIEKLFAVSASYF